MTLVAISVDPPEVTIPWAEKNSFTFALASDAKLELARALHLQNPEVDGLPLHAVILVDESGRVFYRKIARRRPKSRELLDAIDWHRAAAGGPGRRARPADPAT